jgi:hypothetical protein
MAEDLRAQGNEAVARGECALAERLYTQALECSCDAQLQADLHSNRSAARLLQQARACHCAWSRHFLRAPVPRYRTPKGR